MTNARQAGAYPSLIPGNRDGARDVLKPWDVVELDGADAMAAGGTGPSTSKEGRILKLPKVILRHDLWIRYHELTHVERPHMLKGKNNLRNLMRQMLEEVAVDGQSLNRDGIDLRPARDYFKWAGFGRPKDVYQAAAMYFQVWTSAQVTTDAELQKFYGECLKLILDAERAEPKLAGLAILLPEAAEAVFNDYSAGNCEDWADIVTAKLLGIPKEDIPDAPEPPGACSSSTGASTGSSQAGASSTPGQPNVPEEDDDDGESGDEAGAPPTGRPAGAGGEDEEADGDGAGSGVCPACDGDGVDEDGEECDACGGTGTDPTEQPGVPDEPSEGNESGTGRDAGDDGPDGDEADDSQEDGTGFSEWDTPPIPVDKNRVNDPMDFGFDPLGKTKVDPNDEPVYPTETTNRERQKITQEQLQEAIDQERVNRKQGEASQAEELSAPTPYGVVDVHRHTLTKGTSQSVALGWRSSEMGSTVRYPSQLFNSGRVFAKRAPGGSIILDGSGSMSWHAQHIMDAQKQMPNLYVAVYSYHGGNGYWSARHGHQTTDTFIARYCILAHKGQLDPQGIERKEAEWQHTGGNSGADPASLFYAARWAPKPIVWVSDGMVSFGEVQGFYKQCDALMRQHKIVRVLTIEDAIEYLLGKAVPGWHQSATVDTHWVRLGQTYMGRSVNPKDTMHEADRWTQLRANSKRR